MASHKLSFAIYLAIAIILVSVIRVNSANVVDIRNVEDFRCETFVSNGIFVAYVDNHDFHYCMKDADEYFKAMRAIYLTSKYNLYVSSFSDSLEMDVRMLSILPDYFPALDSRNKSIIPYVVGTELMIDTGGSNTMVFTDRHDDEYEEFLENSNASGRITLLSGYSDIEVQGTKIHGVIEHPINGVNSKFIGDEVTSGSGQLGIDFFYALKNVCLDFEKSLLRSTCEGLDLGDRYGIPLYKRGSRLYVPLIVKGRRVMAFIDTGSGVSILVSGLCNPRYDFEATTIYGGVSSYKVSVLLYQLDFHDYKLDDHAVLCVHSDNEEFDSWLLGGNFFSRFSYVEFDFNSGMMFLGVNK